VDVVVAGGHGQVALHLERLLSARGDRVRGLIRDPAHAGDLEAAGAEPAVCDMEAEDDLAPFVEGADAVVFAAGAGPGSGPERKRTVDLGAAVKLIETGVRRYVMISAVGAHDPSAGPEQMRPYLEAKAEADRRLAESGLDYTIVRPGRLTNDPARGTVLVSDNPATYGEIPRADVAAVVGACLIDPASVGKTFVVVGGETPVTAAVGALR
jgi:uncharacterized protein YbjT (DUF2867 family)